MSALWSDGRLLFTTHTEICCLYPTHAEDGPLTLASLDAVRMCSPQQDASGVAARTWCWDDSCVPPPQLRPVGALSLVRVVQERLVMMDVSNTLLELDISNISSVFMKL